MYQISYKYESLVLCRWGDKGEKDYFLILELIAHFCYNFSVFGLFDLSIVQNILSKKVQQKDVLSASLLLIFCTVHFLFVAGTETASNTFFNYSIVGKLLFICSGSASLKLVSRNANQFIEIAQSIFGDQPIFVFTQNYANSRLVIRVTQQVVSYRKVRIYLTRKFCSGWKSYIFKSTTTQQRKCR